MSVFKNGYGTIYHPAHKFVTNVAHAPAPKHLTRAPKLENYKPSYDPKYALPPREWVAAQITAATTVATRREWFRVMSWNVMTDAISTHQPPAQRSGRNVEEKRQIDSGEIVIPPEPAIAAKPTAIVKTGALPSELLSWDYRVCKITDEILFHDPDLIMLNEVNRTHFNSSLWKMLRSQGYGALFVSNKLDRCLTSPMDNPDVRDAKNPHMRGRRPLRFEEDVGNAIFYHKGRFFPYHMPGLETPNTIPYMHAAGLRDRVTNLCVMCVACQFSAGDGPEAAEAREWEARGMLRVLDTINRNGNDRGFTGTIVAGDFNNADIDEPCVSMMQDRYGSAYDVVGGARWTTWYRAEPGKEWGEQRHLHKDWKRRNNSPEVFEAKAVTDAVRGYMKERAAQRRLAEGNIAPIKSTVDEEEAAAAAAASNASASASSSSTDGGAQAEPAVAEPTPAVAEHAEAAASAADVATAAASNAAAEAAAAGTPLKEASEHVTSGAPSDAATAEEPAAAQTTALVPEEDEPIIKPGKVRKHEAMVREMVAVAKAHGLETIREIDALEKSKAIELRKKGIVKRVSDFIFFDESMLTTLRVLDTPSDSAVDPNQLLPNEAVPSHHLPLVVDMCWNTHAPEAPTREKGEKN